MAMKTNSHIDRRAATDHSLATSKESERETSSSIAAPFLSFFLLLSITANIVLLSGCRSVHDFVYGNPCEYQNRPRNDPFIPAEDGSALRAKLVKLANIAHVESRDKKNEVLAGDIVTALEKEKRLQDDRSEVLRKIDFSLDGGNVESKTDDDLVEDIQNRVRDLKTKHDKLKEKSSASTPTPFTDFEAMAKDLPPPWEKAMRSYHVFIKELQGKRVIVLDPED